MALNKVEYHVPHTAFFTFGVKAGEVLEAGSLVKITGDREVGQAGAGDDVLGVVYSGTVGKSKYAGDDNDAVTVVVNKPFVYLTASDVVAAGAELAAAEDNKVVTAVEGAGTFAKAITSATAQDEVIIAILL